MSAPASSSPGTLVRGVALLALVACAACSPEPSTRPYNVILVNLDDVRADAVDRMPTVQALAARGMTFDRAIATTPVCAQSRATILTGLVPRHHGLEIFSAGVEAIRQSGADRRTLGTWFQAAGARTALVGKYVNGYAEGTEDPDGDGKMFVPPGWNVWRAWRSPERSGGVHGGDYAVSNDDGTFTWHRNHETDAEYATDVQKTMVVDTIDAAHAADAPFFVYWAPLAAHPDTQVVAAPAARHYDTLTALPPHQAASLGAPGDDKPRYATHATAPEQLDEMVKFTALSRRRSYESLLAVDEGLRDVLAQLRTIGELDRTIIVVTADNGVLWGEHGLYGGGKNVPYQEALRVPLIMAGPGIPHGRSDALVRMEDIAPTLLELAGVTVPDGLDGRSAAGWAHGETIADWDDVVTVRGWQINAGDWLRYRGNPRVGTRVRLFYGPAAAGSAQASVVFQFTDKAHPAAADAVAVPRGATPRASMTALASAVRRRVPNVRVVHVPNGKVTVITDDPKSGSPIWWIDGDGDPALAPLYPTPTFCGVVTERAKLIAYSTGERELYLLDDDPAELRNRAGDPAVADDEKSLLALLRERCA